MLKFFLKQTAVQSMCEVSDNNVDLHRLTDIRLHEALLSFNLFFSLLRELLILISV